MFASVFLVHTLFLEKSGKVESQLHESRAPILSLINSDGLFGLTLVTGLYYVH